MDDSTDKFEPVSEDVGFYHSAIRLRKLISGHEPQSFNQLLKVLIDTHGNNERVDGRLDVLIEALILFYNDRKFSSSIISDHLRLSQPETASLMDALVSTGFIIPGEEFSNYITIDRPITRPSEFLGVWRFKRLFTIIEEQVPRELYPDYPSRIRSAITAIQSAAPTASTEKKPVKTRRLRRLLPFLFRLFRQRKTPSEKVTSPVPIYAMNIDEATADVNEILNLLGPPPDSSGNELVTPNPTPAGVS